MTDSDRPFNEERMYDRFPEGREEGHGTEAGFNTVFRLNDASLFRPELLDESNDAYLPALSEFARAAMSSASPLCSSRAAHANRSGSFTSHT